MSRPADRSSSRERGPRRASAVHLGLGSVAVLVLLALAWRAGWASDLWRAAYPHLPSRVQGLPYQLRSALPGPELTPVALPLPVPAKDLPGETADLAAAPAMTGAAAVAPTLSSAMTAAVTPAPPLSPTATPRPAPTLPAPTLPATASLDALRHNYQTWNNCGPATVDMALSAWQVPGDQAQAAVRLKPDPDDKNVSPAELARYAAERGLEAPVLHGGDLATLRRLAALAVPVILETWFVPEPGDEMGHYRLLVGYRDGGETLLFHDSYLGPDLAIPAAEVDRDWRVFNRVYVPVYPAERSGAVAAAVGPAMGDPRVMWTAAAAAAQAEVVAVDDAFAHFNLGTSLAGLGDLPAAAMAFDRARERGLPWRMLWYQHAPFAAYAAQGRWADVAALAQANLRNAPNLEESLLWRAAAAEADGREGEALGDLRRAVRLNPLHPPAAAALDAAEAGASVRDALRSAGAGLPAGALRGASP